MTPQRMTPTEALQAADDHERIAEHIDAFADEHQARELYYRSRADEHRAQARALRRARSDQAVA